MGHRLIHKVHRENKHSCDARCAHPRRPASLRSPVKVRRFNVSYLLYVEGVLLKYWPYSQNVYCLNDHNKNN